MEKSDLSLSFNKTIEESLFKSESDEKSIQTQNSDFQDLKSSNPVLNLNKYKESTPQNSIRIIKDDSVNESDKIKFQRHLSIPSAPHSLKINNLNSGFQNLKSSSQILNMNKNKETTPKNSIRIVIENSPNESDNINVQRSVSFPHEPQYLKVAETSESFKASRKNSIIKKNSVNMTDSDNTKVSRKISNHESRRVSFWKNDSNNNWQSLDTGSDFNKDTNKDLDNF